MAGQEGSGAARLGVHDRRLRQRCFHERAGPKRPASAFFFLYFVARLLLADLKIILHSMKHVDLSIMQTGCRWHNSLHRLHIMKRHMLVPAGRVKSGKTFSNPGCAKLGSLLSTRFYRVPRRNQGWVQGLHRCPRPSVVRIQRIRVSKGSTLFVMMGLCWLSLWQLAWAVWRTPISSSLRLSHPTSSPFRLLPDLRSWWIRLRQGCTLACVKRLMVSSDLPPSLRVSGIR